MHISLLQNEINYNNHVWTYIQCLMLHLVNWKCQEKHLKSTRRFKLIIEINSNLKKIKMAPKGRRDIFVDAKILKIQHFVSYKTRCTIEFLRFC